MIALETKRLSGRAPLETDLPHLRMIHGDPRAMATLSVDGQPAGEEYSAGVLARIREHWERYGFGVWMLFEKDAKRFAGYAGIRHIELEGAAEIELLYAIRSDRWRTGYATEAAAEVLRLGFRDLAPASVVAFTLPHNRGSRGVMEKCGMRFERDMIHAGLPHVLYRITAAEFAALTRSAAT
ncbi:MAG TPA: GNAT family protein [Candidatus Binataceae bacterium]|nr:GNAT family protein [Candidatus Binataceae bacterium]